jgi:hypothetical protein
MPDTPDIPAAAMTLRDFFAAHALAGLMATANTGELSFGELAVDAWSVADSMLAERAEVADAALDGAA